MLLQVEAEYDIWFAEQNRGLDGWALLLGILYLMAYCIYKLDYALQPTTIYLSTTVLILGYLFICHRNLFCAQRDLLFSTM
jgi:hypothetical protein